MNVNHEQVSPRNAKPVIARWLWVAGCALVVLSAFTWPQRGEVAIAQDRQQQATTQPSTTTPPPPTGRTLQPRAGRMRPQVLAGAPAAAAAEGSEETDSDLGPTERAGERGGRDGARARAPTTQEREAAFDFVRENAPIRWQWFNRFPINSPPRARIGHMMTIGYRQIARFKDSDPELYETLRRRVQVQDEAFGIMRRMWRNNYELDADQTMLVRQKATEVVELSMQERERRIARLERQLKEQKAKLEADRANTEPLIDAQAKKMKDEAADMLRRFSELARQNNYPGFPQGMQQQPAPTTEPSK